jgi:hypothetical protein
MVGCFLFFSFGFGSTVLTGLKRALLFRGCFKENRQNHISRKPAGVCTKVLQKFAFLAKIFGSRYFRPVRAESFSRRRSDAA